MCISLLTALHTVDYHSGKLNNFSAGLCTKTQPKHVSHILSPKIHKLSRAFYLLRLRRYFQKIPVLYYFVPYSFICLMSRWIVGSR